MPAPDLVIYLQAPTDVLLRRLRERERAESGARAQPGDDYLRELNEAYHHFFFHYTATPLLVVETSQFDLPWSDEALDDLDQADPEHGPRHALLRAADLTPARRSRRTGSFLPAQPLDCTLRWYMLPSWRGSRRPASRSSRRRTSQPGARRALGQVPGCAQIIYNKDLAANLQRLPEVRASLPARAPPSGCGRCSTATGTSTTPDLASTDPLQLHRHQAVQERASRRSIAGTGLKDAVIIATGPHRRHRRCVVAAMEYGFIGGSMGVVVGEKITRGDRARDRRAAAGRHRLAARAARG